MWNPVDLYTQSIFSYVQASCNINYRKLSKNSVLCDAYPYGISAVTVRIPRSQICMLLYLYTVFTCDKLLWFLVLINCPFHFIV